MIATKRTPFEPARVKLSIGSLDDPSLAVHAQYNPKEVQLKRTVPWTDHKKEIVEFGGTKPRAMSVELLFDGFEQHRSIQPQLDVLERLATVRGHARDNDPALQRPHWCVVAWGDAMPKLRCVIESVTVKYSMFSDDGTPLRAVATVELKEAAAVDQHPRGKSAKAKR